MARQFPWTLVSVPWSQDPQFTRGTHDGTGLPLLSWGIAPKGKLATYRQLRARGLRPGGQDPVAVLYFRHRPSAHFTYGYLYLVSLAKPVRPMTSAKRAAVEAALAARRRCPECGEDSGPYIRRSMGMCEACQYTRGLWEPTDARHDYVLGEPTASPEELAGMPALAELLCASTVACLTSNNNNPYEITRGELIAA